MQNRRGGDWFDAMNANRKCKWNQPLDKKHTSAVEGSGEILEHGTRRKAVEKQPKKIRRERRETVKFTHGWIELAILRTRLFRIEHNRWTIARWDERVDEYCDRTLNGDKSRETWRSKKSGRWETDTVHKQAALYHVWTAEKVNGEPRTNGKESAGMVGAEWVCVCVIHVSGERNANESRAWKCKVTAQLIQLEGWIRVIMAKTNADKKTPNKIRKGKDGMASRVRRIKRMMTGIRRAIRRQSACEGGWEWNSERFGDQLAMITLN